MRKLTLLLLSVFALTAVAQVTTVPAIIQKGYDGEVTIIFNPNEGNGGMKDDATLVNIGAKDIDNIVISKLENEYKGASTALIYDGNYQLLVAVMLSAQCTDERVNKVTAVLFKDYGTPQKMSALSQEKLAQIIKPCGLFNAKAKHILSATNAILTRYNGEVPTTFNELIALDGVGRKTADVMIAVAFGGDAIAVDTHVFRVSNRIGLVKAKNPLNTELQLQKVIEKSKWSSAHHYILWHGRKVCSARNPKCGECFLNKECDYYKKNLRKNNL